MLIGERGVGKTFGATKFVIDRFLKKNEQFVYLRRFNSELKDALPDFFTKINKECDYENKFEVKGNKFYCDGKQMGYGINLSTSQRKKSSNFDNVKTVIFDEFIIESGQKLYYLQNEVFVFLNTLESIGRLEDLRVLMLSNAANSNNPYFAYFNLSMPYNNDIKTFKDNTILVQYMKNEEYRKVKKQTAFGKLVAGTSYEDYAINNKFINDNKNFIEKKSGSSHFKFAFIYNEETYGVWFDLNNSKIFISTDYIKNTPFIFSCTLDDHSENTMFLKSAKKYRCWKVLIEQFELGNVRFENMKIKNIVSQLIKSLLYC